MIRRYLFPIILTAMSILAAFILFFNSNFFLSVFFNKLLQERFHHAELLSFQAEQQFYKHPDKLVLKNVTSALRYQKDIFRIEVDEIILHDIIQFWKNKEKLRMTITGFNLYVRRMAWRSFDLNVTLDFQGRDFVGLQGIFRKMLFASDPYVIYDISGKVKIDKRYIEIVELTGFWDTSLCQGQVKMARGPQMEFTLFLEFLNLNSGELKVGDNIFGGIHGLVDGRLRMAGTKHDIDLFVLDLSMSRGGEIEPGLLGVLESLASAQEIKNEFSSLMAQDKALEFEKAAFLIQDFHDYRAQIMVHIISHGANINWMERIPIKRRVNWLEFLGF